MPMSRFARAAWEKGESRATFACLISGTAYPVPSLRNSLFGSKRLVPAWDKSEVVARSFMINKDIARALAGSAHSGIWCLIAFDIIIGYSGMFRVMELLSLTAGSLTGTLVDASVTLMLQATKTSSRKQTTETVTIANPKAATALILLAAEKLPGDPKTMVPIPCCCCSRSGKVSALEVAGAAGADTGSATVTAENSMWPVTCQIPSWSALTAPNGVIAQCTIAASQMAWPTGTANALNFIRFTRPPDTPNSFRRARATQRFREIEVSMLLQKRVVGTYSRHAANM
jgi:hypothetical protein